MNKYFKKKLSSKFIFLLIASIVVFILPYDFNIEFRFLLITLAFFTQTINLQKEYDICELRFQCDVNYPDKTPVERLDIYRTELCFLNTEYSFQKKMSIIQLALMVLLIVNYLYVFNKDATVLSPVHAGICIAQILLMLFSSLRMITAVFKEIKNSNS